MKTVCYFAVPFVKEEVTLALESGITTLIVPDEVIELAQGLARCTIIPLSQTASLTLTSKTDEEKALDCLTNGLVTILEKGWEIIPVENLLAHEERLHKNIATQCAGDMAREPLRKPQSEERQPDCLAIDAKNQAGQKKQAEQETQKQQTLQRHPKGQENTPRVGQLALEVCDDNEARLAAKILERGVSMLIVKQQHLAHITAILGAVQEEATAFSLEEAVITSITPVGIGHRVCVDTLSLLTTGQGMLVGNSAGFTFLVNAETERNEYVASRPFRVNAGAVHSYCMMPGDTTAYLEEIQSGREVLILDHTGKTSTAIVGRAKVERRPMLHITAQIGERQGSVFLQNAETIRLVKPDGTPISVVSLAVGDAILCHQDTAGRHFGMRISEDIAEG